MHPACGIGAATGFQFQMDAIGRQHRHIRRVTHHVHQQQRDDPLPVGRAFVDGFAREVGRDGRDVIAPGVGEVFHRVQTAQTLEGLDHLSCERAAIERVPPFARDHLQRARQFRLPVDGTDFRHHSVRQEDASEGVVGSQMVGVLGPVGMNPW